MISVSNPIVLMYHGILSEPPVIIPNDRETGADIYDLSIKNFNNQMQWLKDHGYTPVFAENTADPLAEKPVIITFDDGELNNSQQALPVLNKLGWKAYFFVIVKRIGKHGYMDWKDLKELLNSGMKIGSHGLTHEVLTNLLDSQMEEELRASKKNLEINLNTPIDTLSIPRGFCNDKIIETAYKLGYKKIFISERPAGLKSECFNRVAVKSHWTLKRFDLALKGKTPFSEHIGNALKKAFKKLFREAGYNWVRATLIKIFK